MPGGAPSQESRGTSRRQVDDRGLQTDRFLAFHKDQLVELILPDLRMATELGGGELAAVLMRGDLLRLKDPHPLGNAQVFYAAVVKTRASQSIGRVGIVRTNWIRPALESALAASGHPAEQPKTTGTRGLPVDTYVDNFKEVIYDPDYRVEEERYSPTNWLRIVYDDATEIDIHFSKILDKPRMNTRDALAQAKPGDGERVFPAELNPQTTPRLWAAKQVALEEQAWWTLQLIKMALPAVIFVITLSMPVGRPGAASPKAQSKRVAGSLKTRARPRASRLQEVQATRLSVGQLQQRAQVLVEQLRSQGKRVVLNIGGGGASHEPPDAINLNVQVPGTQRRAIPNLIEAPAESLGSVFPADQVDEIVGFRLAPQTFRWEQIATGAFRILKSRGKVWIQFKWANHEYALRLAKALREAGFEVPSILGDGAVTTIKP
jgi:hypothetical protein